jgi:hypothetical protein
MHPDGCDHCNRRDELYHFDATYKGNPLDGGALCEQCNTLGVQIDEAIQAAHDSQIAAQEALAGRVEQRLHLFVGGQTVELRVYAEAGA